MADVAKCPFCLEWVRTAGILEPTRVQCPVCETQFSSSELLDLQPPELLVLPSLPAPEADWQTEGAAAERASADGTESIVILPPSRPDEASGPSTGPLQADADVLDPRPIVGGGIPSPFVTPPPAGSASISRRWRAQRGRRNPTTELLKIVLGGIAGIVIAQLILWWLPGNLRRDPFGLAPRLPVWLQWVRPSNWDPPTAVSQHERSSDFPAARPDPFADDPSFSALPTDTSSDRSAPKAPGSPGDIAPASAWMAEDDVVGSGNAQLARRLDSPVYTGPELRQALAAVRTALESYETSPPANRVERRNQQRILYQRLCDVAQIVSYLDADDPEIGPHMQAVEATLRRFTANATLRRLVAEAADSWILFPARTSDGIALIGRVVQIRPLDATFETELQLHSQAGRQVSILSSTDPTQDAREPYAVGDELILLGSLLTGAPSAESSSGSNWTIWTGFHTVCDP